MANLNLSKIFEKDLSQMDRDVYEHLQQKVELFASLKKQIDEICKVAHSKFELQDYLQVAYMTYELKATKLQILCCLRTCQSDFVDISNT